MRCNTCKVELNQPDKPGTQDCGGDCTRCMAECGDPECIATMQKAEPENGWWFEDVS